MKVWSIHWANRSHKYLRDLTDWTALCIPCHRKHDGLTGSKHPEEQKKKISEGLKLAYREGRRKGSHYKLLTT